MSVAAFVLYLPVGWGASRSGWEPADEVGVGCSGQLLLRQRRRHNKALMRLAPLSRTPVRSAPASIAARR